jgi:transposase
LAYFLLDTVAELNLGPLLARYEREPRGHPPHPPRMRVGLLLYASCVGVASSRGSEKKTYADLAFRVIAAGPHPDPTCVSEFRRQHLDVLAGLFVQVLALCQKAGLVKLGHVALDGTNPPPDGPQRVHRHRRWLPSHGTAARHNGGVLPAEHILTGALAQTMADERL